MNKFLTLPRNLPTATCQFYHSLRLPHYKLSTFDTLVHRILIPPFSSTMDQSPVHHSRPPLDPDILLAIDLRKHHGDADKLFAIAKDFQQLGFDLHAEVVRLKTEANLAKSQSKGSSRRDTDDSDYSLKKGLEDFRIGIAITYDPSDNSLAVRSGEAMKGKYSFQSTSIRLNVYPQI